MLTALLFFHAGPALGSIALFMEDPYGHFGAWNPTGHAAIYLDNVCASSPLVLRRCLPGERGVVISRYHKVHHDDWLAMDVVPYLYAVDELVDAPVRLSDRHQEQALREKYWRAHLTELAPPENGEAPKGNWIQLVGSTFDRTIHVFQAPTTPEQDDRFIADFNAKKNQSHFNLFFHNCADFSRVVLNTYFPDAIHRNYVGDFGFTTPKQVARRMVEYSRKHPDLAVTQFVIPQIPGDIARSHRIRGVSESLVKTPRLLVPTLIVEPEVTGVSALAYLFTGRFEFEHNAPTFTLPGSGSLPAQADSEKHIP